MAHFADDVYWSRTFDLECADSLLQLDAKHIASSVACINHVAWLLQAKGIHWCERGAVDLHEDILNLVAERDPCS